MLRRRRKRPAAEHVGGVHGYQRFLEIMANPDDAEHGDTKRWCGGHFDPAWFDLAMLDRDMKNALRKNVRRRLRQPKPKRAAPRRKPDHRDIAENLGQSGGP